MSWTTLRTLLAGKLSGQVPSTILRAEQSTGQLPMAFQLEEHTEHYLALESGEGKTRGMLTGLSAGVGGVFLLLFSIAFFLDGRYQPAMEVFGIALIGSLIPF